MTLVQPKPARESRVGLKSARLKPVVILFVKAPRVGAVKTRLGADIGALAAWQFYGETVRLLARSLASASSWELVFAISPDRAARHVARSFLQAPGLATMTQGMGDIGTRMARCLDRCSPAPRLLIGGDIPGVTHSIIDQSFNKLANADVVLGPAEDGGFWLVGARGPCRLHGLFNDVQWSSDRALAQVQANVPGHMRLALTEMLADIDDGAALAAWQTRLRAHAVS